MNIIDPINVDTARNRVLAILQITLACLFAAGISLYFVIRRVHAVDGELARVEAALSARQKKYARRSLPEQTSLDEQRNQQLRQMWEQLRLQVDTFHGVLPERASFAMAEDARIDFKVAVISARQALQEMATSHGVELTADLGITETIDTGDVTETRLWELAAVVRLVELLISTKVQAIDAITSLPPFIYAEVPSENEVAVAFPVRIDVRCRYDQLKPLLDSLGQEDSFYAVGQCQISRPSLAGNSLLVQLECSALRFVVGAAPRGPEDGADTAPPDNPPVRRRGDAR
jgi:hypothetical protein